MAILKEPHRGFVLEEVIIRQAETTDRPKIVSSMALLQEVERRMDLYRTEPEEMAAPHVAALEKWCVEHEGGFLIAEHEGEMIGMLVYGMLEKFGFVIPAELRRHGLITDLIVAENFRERGVGRRLLEDAETLLRARGAGRIEITTLFENIEARAFYESRGYMPYDVAYTKLL